MENKKFLPPSHGGDRRQFSQRFSIPDEKIIDFSSNINPLGLHPSIQEIISSHLNELLYYPDPRCEELRITLSQEHNVSKESIIVGNGAAELIYLLTSTLTPQRGLILEPNFSEYNKSLRLENCQITQPKGNEDQNFKLPVGEIISLIPGHDMVFLSNPNNPVGYIYSQKELLEILEVCERNQCYMVIDEAFIQFTGEGIKKSMIKYLLDYPRLIVLQSYTKILAIPGLRLGMLYGSKHLIKKMFSQKIPWSVNTLAQKVGVAMTREDDFIRKTCEFVIEERKWMLQELLEIKEFSTFNSEANYMLCKIVKGQCLEDLENFLGKNGIMIRNCSNYIGLDNRFFRIAIRSEKDNQRLISLLKEFSTPC